MSAETGAGVTCAKSGGKLAASENKHSGTAVERSESPIRIRIPAISCHDVFGTNRVPWWWRTRLFLICLLCATQQGCLGTELAEALGRYSGGDGEARGVARECWLLPSSFRSGALFDPVIPWMNCWRMNQ